MREEGCWDMAAASDDDPLKYMPCIAYMTRTHSMCMACTMKGVGASLKLPVSVVQDEC